MKHLEMLDLKWNKIQEFLPSITKLKTLKMSLKHLDLSFNPFTDVLRENEISYFVCKYLPSLETFNNSTMQRVFCNNNFVLKDYKQLPMFELNNRPLTTKWSSELCVNKTEDENDNHLAEDFKKLIVCVSIKMKDINQFRSVLPLEHVRWLNLSNNLLSSIIYLKKMPKLEEINLSNNVLEKFDCVHDSLSRLVKLNLSCNYLTSLNEFRSAHFPNLKVSVLVL